VGKALRLYILLSSAAFTHASYAINPTPTTRYKTHAKNVKLLKSALQLHTRMLKLAKLAANNPK